MKTAILVAQARAMYHSRHRLGYRVVEHVETRPLGRMAFAVLVKAVDFSGRWFRYGLLIRQENVEVDDYTPAQFRQLRRAAA